MKSWLWIGLAGALLAGCATTSSSKTTEKKKKKTTAAAVAEAQQSMGATSPAAVTATRDTAATVRYLEMRRK